MKLITEEIEKVKVIVEETNGKKSLFIEGIFLQANKPNRNKRLYEMRTLEREVKRYNENYIQKGRALGELGHPDGPSLNLDRVSHKIVCLERFGDNFRGRAKILSTPMGKIASSLLGEGVMLGVSSRGVGSLIPTNEGYSVVGEDFMLATAATVASVNATNSAGTGGFNRIITLTWNTSSQGAPITTSTGVLRRTTKVAAYGASGKLHITEIQIAGG